MPLYEYQCPSCDSQFELLRPMSKADEDISCPTCHNGARRTISTFASFSRSSDGTSTALAGSGMG